MTTYRQQIADSLEIIKKELVLVQATTAELERELEGLYRDFKKARGQRHRARINIDIERVESQLTNLEVQQHKLQKKLQAADMTEQDL